MIKRDKKTRDQIQSEAIMSNIDNDFASTLVMCTGAGKSKCAIDLATLCVSNKNDSRILLVVPTQKLRDKNWKDEFEKWNHLKIFEENLVKTCYASLLKYKDEEFDMIIFDEVHHVTERHIEFFESCLTRRVLGLTATMPDDPLKLSIIDAVMPVSYEYTFEEGIYDGIISEFEMNVIYVDLDDKFKYIEAGSKKRRFYQTELEKNDYLNTRIEALKEEGLAVRKKLNDYIDEKGFYHEDEVVLKYKKEIDKLAARRETLIFNRLHFIKQLKSKTIAAQELFNHIYQEGKRYVLFCGSIPQANELCENRFHSQVDGTDYDRFVNEEINVLSVVDALNEGHNIPNLDEMIAVQLSSKELALIQRIGRFVRFRENYVAQIYILVARNTVDERWFKSATESFSTIKTRYYNSVEDFKMNLEYYTLAA